LAHFFDGLVWSQVGLGDLKAEGPEHIARDGLSTAAGVAKVDKLTGEIGNLPDIFSRYDMKLFVEELGDVDKPVLEITQLFALVQTSEHGLLYDRHVHPGKRENIPDIVNSAATDNREHAQRQLSVRTSLLPSRKNSRDFIDERESAFFRRPSDNPDCIRVPSRCGLF
jgi:hypothetical protein